MDLSEHPSFDAHCRVLFVCEPSARLNCIVAVHRYYAGKAAGGVRFWPYETEEAALNDVLRLSRGMSYKFALGGLEMGGAKSVIIGDPKKDKTPELLKNFARVVDEFAGAYICGPDVGTTAADMEVVASATEHVRCRADGHGEPSPATAYGVLQGIRAALEHARGCGELNGVHVMVQGLGSVGWHLSEYLSERGAKLSVSDIDGDKVARAVREFGATAVAPEDVYAVEADVFAPCALGGILTAETIDALKVPIVCGAANNQLQDDAAGARLAERGITYVPDYAANVGGAIKGLMEGPGYDDQVIRERVRALRDRIRDILDKAAEEGIPTNVAADRIAEEKIRAFP